MTRTRRVFLPPLLAAMLIPPLPAIAADDAADAAVIVRYTDSFRADAEHLEQLLEGAGYAVNVERVEERSAKQLGNTLRLSVLHLPGDAAPAGAIRDIVADALGDGQWRTRRARPLVGADGRLVDPRATLDHGDELHRYLVYLYPENEHARFFEAAAAGEIVTLLRLLAQGIDVDARDYSGSTALMIAAREGNAEVVDLLLSVGADVHVRNMHDTTALLNAVYMNHLEVVRLLVGSGADARVRNIDGSALEIAFDLSHLEIAEFLKRQLERLEI